MTAEPIDVTVDIGVTFTVVPVPGMTDQILEAALARLMNDMYVIEDTHNVQVFRYDDDIDEALGKALAYIPPSQRRR